MDRVVSYAFRGNFNQFTAGLTAAGRGVQDFGTKLTALDRDGVKMRAGLDTLGRSAGRVGLVAAGGLGLMVAAAANFDAAMSKVQAATHESAENMDRLRAAAIKAGAETVYSATEAAGAIESLAKAGVSADDILSGGLTGALNLAAAGGLEVADAADIAATALTQFKLEGSDVSHVADLLAAGAGKAQGDVTDLGFALKQSGLVASQMGLSLEATTGTLAAFASAGLIGSDAGTSFRQLLLSLANPTQKAAGLMDSLGIAAYDAQGNFAGLTNLAGQLAEAFKNKTKEERDSALATIFGSDAIRAASVLYDQGADGIQGWINKTNDAGYAAETAATRLDNLKGDLEQFRGALETALIGGGDGSQGILRPLVQGATDLVNIFNKLPAPLQNVSSGLLAITAVTGGALWFGSKVVNGVADTRQALSDLGITAGNTKGKLAGVGVGIKGLAVGATLLAGLAALDATLGNLQDKDPRPTLNELANALNDLSAGKVGDVNDKVYDLATAMDTLGSTFVDVGSKIQSIPGGGTLTEIADGIGGLIGAGVTPKTARDNAQKQISDLDAALAQLVGNKSIEVAADAFKKLAESQGLSADEQTQLMNILPGYRDAIAGAQGATEDAAGSTEDFGTATRALAAASKLSAEDLKKLNESATKTGEAFFGLGDSVDDSKVSLDRWIQDLRDQAKALEDFTANARRAGKKGLREGLINELEAAGPAGALRMKQLADGTQEEIRRANRAWARGQRAIEAYVAMKVPDKEIGVNTAPAIRDLKSLQAFMASISGATVPTPKSDKGLSGLLGTHTNNDGTVDRDGNPKTGKGHAVGGLIYGPGTKTSDSVPAMLSQGEFVIRAAAVDAYGAEFFDKANRLKLAGGGGVGRGLKSYVTSDKYLGMDAFPRTLKQWNRALERSTKVVEREKDERQALIDKRDAVSSAIQSSYRSDLWGQQSDGNVWMSPEDRAKAGVGDVRSTLTGDITNLKALESAIAMLKKKGFDGPALAELLSNGSLTEVQAYAGESKSSLASLEALFNQRDKLLASTGAAGGNAAFGTALAAQTAEWKRIAGYNRELNARFDRIEKQLKKAPKETGDEVGKAVNGSAPKRGRT